MRGYNYRNCQSLFGYAENVHQRSGGVCQLCGAGSGQRVDFDFWRQLTVEHLIGQSQGGYLPQIRKLLTRWFPSLSVTTREEYAILLDRKNTVTACAFCNSVTSRSRNPRSMEDLISSSTIPDAALQNTTEELQAILERKRADIKGKLESIRGAFDRLIEPKLLETRKLPPLTEPLLRR
jgi:hypothetical protein